MLLLEIGDHRLNEYRGMSKCCFGNEPMDNSVEIEQIFVASFLQNAQCANGVDPATVRDPTSRPLINQE